MSSREPLKEEIRDFIARMNDAWVQGHPELLTSFFSEDIVMVHPDFSQRTEGREACVAAYADFCTQASIQELKPGEPSIDLFGDTAVATYAYEITYQMAGESFVDTGRDLFIFVRENGEWRAVWRTMILAKPESVN